ncbi:hypothetical protein TNCT_505681 [Trichonephila clavata]|uniref:Secreted protein n=1 Tax=Trichonephila clavata TaxID=2740835 RepID=A0A8X6JBV8_TRICU|nr:hypothetical protein TNCT_505681 [Trichonephila clavata]
MTYLHFAWLRAAFSCTIAVSWDVEVVSVSIPMEVSVQGFQKHAPSANGTAPYKIWQTGYNCLLSVQNCDSWCTSNFPDNSSILTTCFPSRFLLAS